MFVNMQEVVSQYLGLCLVFFSDSKSSVYLSQTNAAYFVKFIINQNASSVLTYLVSVIVKSS